MAFLPEDGSGLPLANAFCPVEFADEWHAARGATLWADLSQTDKERALVRACQYITQEYRARWAGWRMTATQALDWPRAYVPYTEGYYTGQAYYADDAVPIEVQQANAELAIKAASGDLSPDITRLIASETKTVGPLTKSVSYVEGGSPNTRYRSLDAMLRPLLKSGGGSIPLFRA